MTDQSATQASLLEMAREARSRAHVPYSGFAMGAAVRCAGGATRPGTLVENVSLGLAMCAERVALFSAVADGCGEPVELALVSKRTGGSLTFPCGACLQVALELGGPDLVVVVSDLDGITESSTIGALLPSGPRLERS